jgi:hypothetical protein
MNVQQFLSHHKLSRNPFVEEDAQTDAVFKDTCIESTFHPAWDKVYGDPNDPATSIVFGQKGSGKTAMRLQLENQLDNHNRSFPQQRVYVISYIDFNTFLGQFEQKAGWWSRGKPERMLQSWKLWDHIDGILSVGVTKFCQRVESNEVADGSDAGLADQLNRLDRGQARDLMLLSLVYDQSTATAFDARFAHLRKKLGYRAYRTWFDFGGGVLWSTVMITLMIWLLAKSHITFTTAMWWFPWITILGWAPYLYRLVRNSWIAWGIKRQMRVGRKTFGQLLYGLMRIPLGELAGQPLPTSQRSDDRYNLLDKFQGILKVLNYQGVVVLMDRVDEPNLINGSPERMRLFVWPILDNKLLKHPGLGLKMMLPQELYRFIEKENRDFHERARLDKQNVIAHFGWTGEALYDLVAARMKACAENDATVRPEDWFDSRISRDRLVQVMQSLQVPRHLFRFLYRLVTEHCKRFTTAQPDFKIQPETFESVLAVYQREQLSLENP